MVFSVCHLVAMTSVCSNPIMWGTLHNVTNIISKQNYIRYGFLNKNFFSSFCGICPNVTMGNKVRKFGMEDGGRRRENKGWRYFLFRFNPIPCPYAWRGIEPAEPAPVQYEVWVNYSLWLGLGWNCEQSLNMYATKTKNKYYKKYNTNNTKILCFDVVHV